jgi:hypothetical protein
MSIHTYLLEGRQLPVRRETLAIDISKAVSLTHKLFICLADFHLCPIYVACTTTLGKENVLDDSKT